MYLFLSCLILLLLLCLPMQHIGIALFSVLSFIGIGLFISKLISIGDKGPLAWYISWYNDFPFGCFMGTGFLLIFLYIIGFVIYANIRPTTTHG